MSIKQQMSQQNTWVTKTGTAGKLGMKENSPIFHFNVWQLAVATSQPVSCLRRHICVTRAGGWSPASDDGVWPDQGISAVSSPPWHGRWSQNKDSTLIAGDWWGPEAPLKTLHRFSPTMGLRMEITFPSTPTEIQCFLFFCLTFVKFLKLRFDSNFEPRLGIIYCWHSDTHALALLMDGSRGRIVTMTI